MNSNKKAFVVLSLLASVALLSTPLQAQEWTEAQKAVWKNVEIYWALGAAQDNVDQRCDQSVGISLRDDRAIGDSPAGPGNRRSPSARKAD